MANTPPVEQRDLRFYLMVLSRRRWIIVLVVVAALAVSIGSSTLQTSMYRSSADVLVRSAPTVGASGSFLQEQELANEVLFARSSGLLETLATELGYVPDVAVATGAASSLVFSATSTEPAEAARAANAYADLFVQERREARLADYLASTEIVRQKLDDVDAALQALDEAYIRDQARLDPDDELAADQLESNYTLERTRLENQRSRYLQVLDDAALAAEFINVSGTEVINPAQEPETRFTPDIARSATTALFLGLVFGIGLALLTDRFDDRVRTKEDFERLTSPIPTLTVVPRLASWSDSDETHVAAIEHPRSAVTESYYSLRTALTFLAIDRPMNIIQLTSPRMRDGKSTTAANLAVALSMAGHSVALVDCDLRRPRLHRFFDLENRHGMTSLLLGKVTIESVAREIERQPGLTVITAGPDRSISPELLSSGNLSTVLREIGQRYEIVIVDTPPVLSVADPLIVAGMVDAVLLVASAMNTHRAQVAATLEALGRVGAPVVGTVLNNFDARARGYAYGYGYGYTLADGYLYGTEMGYTSDHVVVPPWRMTSQSGRRNRHKDGAA